MAARGGGCRIRQPHSTHTPHWNPRTLALTCACQRLSGADSMLGGQRSGQNITVADIEFIWHLSGSKCTSIVRAKIIDSRSACDGRKKKKGPGANHTIPSSPNTSTRILPLISLYEVMVRNIPLWMCNKSKNNHILGENANAKLS